MRRPVCFLLLLALVGCAHCAARQGGLNADAVSDLRREKVCWASRDGIYIARGDGSNSARIVKAVDLRKDASVLLPSMPSTGADRLLFLSLLDLNPGDATGTALTLNILDLEGDRIEFWRHISLAKIVAADPGGRYSLFSVPAAAWSPDGRHIVLALRREGPAGDAVLLMDGEGSPTAVIDIAPERLARGTSLSWGPTLGTLYVGLQGPPGQDTGVIGVLGWKGFGAGVVRWDPRREIARKWVLVSGPGAYPAVSSEGRIAVVEPGDVVSLLGRDGARVDRLEGAEGRAKNRLFWSRDGRYLYYYTLIPSGPLGLGQVTVLRCLDTLGGGDFDLVRLR